MPDRPRLIALTGYAGAGKDTAASFLVSAAGYQAIAFADALRREVAAAWRIDHRMLTDRATKEWPVPALAAGNCGEPGFVAWCNDSGHSLTEPRSARWVMQNWGSWVRRGAPQHYAHIVVAWAQRQAGIGWRRLVVTDLRYPNEATALRALAPAFDVRLVRVHRPAQPGTAALAADTAAHDSERIERLRVDADITNEGTLPALAAQVLQLAGVDHADE